MSSNESLACGQSFNGFEPGNFVENNLKVTWAVICSASVNHIFDCSSLLNRFHVNMWHMKKPTASNHHPPQNSKNCPSVESGQKGSANAYWPVCNGWLDIFRSKNSKHISKNIAQVKNEDLTYQHILPNISFPGLHLFCSVDKPLACFNIGKTISQREHTKLDNDAHHKPQEKKAQDLKKRAR